MNVVETLLMLKGKQLRGLRSQQTVMYPSGDFLELNTMPTLLHWQEGDEGEQGFIRLDCTENDNYNNVFTVRNQEHPYPLSFDIEDGLYINVSGSVLAINETIKDVKLFTFDHVPDSVSGVALYTEKGVLFIAATMFFMECTFAEKLVARDTGLKEVAL
ncbi:hypothetical protein ACFO4L_01265 [Bacillus daqingensis]|uniref:Uncharacterized protein n=1 Tax=Bacillus daqingensis TaxID=872396 RepID=A0ABV9NRY9_9BACI